MALRTVCLVCLRVNLNNFSDLLSFNLLPPPDKTFHLSNTLISDHKLKKIHPFVGRFVNRITQKLMNRVPQIGTCGLALDKRDGTR